MGSCPFAELQGDSFAVVAEYLAENLAVYPAEPAAFGVDTSQH